MHLYLGVTQPNQVKAHDTLSRKVPSEHFVNEASVYGCQVCCRAAGVQLQYEESVPESTVARDSLQFSCAKEMVGAKSVILFRHMHPESYSCVVCCGRALLL